MEELKTILEGRNKEIQDMQEQMCKKFTDTEEYNQLIAQLEEKDNILKQKDEEMELMYNQISSFDEERKAITSENDKGNDETEELKKKYDDLSKDYDELLKELAEVQKE